MIHREGFSADGDAGRCDCVDNWGELCIDIEVNLFRSRQDVGEIAESKCVHEKERVSRPIAGVR